MSIFNALRPLLPEGLILSDEPMSCHTSFKIGGPAEVYVTPEDTNQLTKVVQACKEAGYPMAIIGGGCNTLVSDEGVKGVVISTQAMSYTEVNGNYITAGSGTKLSKLAEAACKAGLSGLEFASGIPGTVGGAVFMNAGAYKFEIKDVCESVTALMPGGKVTCYQKQELALGYRTSRFQNQTEIIIEAKFKLTPGDPEEIKAEILRLNNKRRASQPLCCPSAGSAFKRPSQPDRYAAKLIDENGLKGFTIGGAQVSEKHAGFIINTGNATAADVLALMKAIQEKIHKISGIWLEPEVQMLGF